MLYWSVLSAPAPGEPQMMKLPLACSPSSKRARVRGGLVGVANVCSLVDLAAEAFRGDVSEVGDGGDVVRVSAYLRCLRLQIFVSVHVLLEVPVRVSVNAGRES